MATCPFAVQRRLPEDRSQPKYRKTLAIIHSQGFRDGDGTLWDDFNRAGMNLESTFFIRWDGVIEQYLDTEVRADANRYANEEAVSIETEDNGDPDHEPWTPAQVRSLIRLLLWLCEVHPGIRRDIADSPFGSGVGFHTLWGAPSAWTPVVKTCPGAVRIDQFYDTILPAVRAGVALAEGDTMTTEQFETLHNTLTTVLVHLDNDANRVKEFQRDVAAGFDAVEVRLVNIDTRLARIEEALAIAVGGATPAPPDPVDTIRALRDTLAAGLA